MAADVRIAIENNEILSPAVNDQTAFVIRNVLACGTEDTGGAGGFRTGRVDVFVPPGTPEYFHELDLTEVEAPLRLAVR
jgi:hypothetical protein